ncbi:MAG: TrkA family potassium uptake protein [Oscillospiraceae bacterium]|nr:TrkA family potassium uptake protein [Oscillospiraceae bacterium]
MRSVLIIGLGRFGKTLAAKFSELGNDVMVVDNQEDNIREFMRYAVNAKIADCTKPEALESLGVRNFDICFVCIGSNFQASLEITSQLKEMGAKKVISKASTNIHAKFLGRNGADEVVYPERDRAEKLAVQYSLSNIFDYTEISSDTGIYEIPILDSWVNHSIIELNIRNKYKINILAIKKDEEVISLPSADYVFCLGDHVLVLGKQKDMEKYVSKIK